MRWAETLDKARSIGFFWAFLICGGSLYSTALRLVHLIMPEMTTLDDNLEPIRQ